MTEIKQSQSDTTESEHGRFVTTVIEDVKDRSKRGYIDEHTKALLDLYLSKVNN